ncbi:hypothetical protein [Rhizobium lentis]|uniref:Saccharopine dehydrogenase-like NADP-dependent oxidoreductase n=1 Tax=Rhizobium lentis TaxID=1138194 RepID=A0A7W8XKX8_9HYPH|nr:hypothetical protein [Rhizobium lentis]MBB4577578.1 saccharopine dehydrogenase-like NADP-dependent oxidoreductase [Rhizobium lentis]MBB5554154.1 saccharopine dehydrogenase-like NADP-dependent oxidoreductase [Rhizobium lentis]MBB5564767.1 saccharopine dehydrogenase-like NADP-dependent oxidoreductase [Rhizobium lentis]MBB5571257.1 saccharopine dehydrogenase-like NADP-dependent oxidoreductase [Rhizobium lentis]
MNGVVAIGAENIGGVIALTLAETRGSNVTMSDRDETQLGKLDKHPTISGAAFELADSPALVSPHRGKLAVPSATPFNPGGKFAEDALEASVHDIDLTEDVATTQKSKKSKKSPKPQMFGLWSAFSRSNSGFGRLHSETLRLTRAVNY